MDVLTKHFERARAISDTTHIRFSRKAESIGIAGGMAPAGIGGIFGDVRGQAKNRESYASFRSWVYSAINALASEAATRPINVGRMLGEEEEPEQKRQLVRNKEFVLSKMTLNIRRKAADQELEVIPRHPLVKLLEKPNPIQYKYQFVYTFVANLNLTGRAYLVVDEVDNKPVIYSLPSTWIRPDHRDGPFSKYHIVNPNDPSSYNEKNALTADQVAMAYLPNPADPMGAMSPANSQTNAIRVDERIQNISEKFFDNGLFPSMVVTVGKQPHPDVPGGMRPRLSGAQRRQVIGAIRRVMGGDDNYGGLAIVDGLIESITRLGATQNEIGWDKSEEKVKMRILSAFCVHPFILGAPVGVGGYAQTYQIEKRFCSRLNVFIDLLSILLTKLLGDKDGLLVWLEQAIPVDPQLEAADWRFARGNNDVSQNEFRARIGLPPDEDKNESVISSALIAPITRLLTAASQGGIAPEQVQAILVGAGLPDTMAKDIAGESKPEQPSSNPTEPVGGDGVMSPEEALAEANKQLQQALVEMRRDIVKEGDAFADKIVGELCGCTLTEKFNPNWASQPRVPAGFPQGGEWSSSGAGGSTGGGKPSKPESKPAETPKQKPTNFSEWKNSLTDSEFSALEDWGGGSYTHIRKCQERNECSEETKQQIKDIKHALETGPKYEGTVYRGLEFVNEKQRASFLSRLTKNGEMTNYSFVSTSKSKKVAEEFGAIGYGVLLRIKSKSGVELRNISPFPEEKEVLMPFGVKWKYSSMKQHSSNKDMVVVEVEEV